METTGNSSPSKDMVTFDGRVEALGLLRVDTEGVENKVHFKGAANNVADAATHCPVISSSGTKLGSISRWEEGVSRTHQLGVVNYYRMLIEMIDVPKKPGESRPPQYVLDLIASLLHVVAEEHGEFRYHGDLRNLNNIKLAHLYEDLLSVGRPTRVQVRLVPSKKKAPAWATIEDLMLKDFIDVRYVVFRIFLSKYHTLPPDLLDLKKKMMDVKEHYQYERQRTKFPIHSSLWSLRARADYFVKINTKLMQADYSTFTFLVDHCLQPIHSLKRWTKKIKRLTNHPFRVMFDDRPYNRQYTNSVKDFISFIRSIPVHILKMEQNNYKYLVHQGDEKFLDKEYVASEIIVIFPTIIREIYSSHSFFRT